MGITNYLGCAGLGGGPGEALGCNFVFFVKDHFSTGSRTMRNRAVSAALDVTRGACVVMLLAVPPETVINMLTSQKIIINFLLVWGKHVWNWGRLVNEFLRELGTPNDPSLTLHMPFASFFG